LSSCWKKVSSKIGVFKLFYFNIQMSMIDLLNIDYYASVHHNAYNEVPLLVHNTKFNYVFSQFLLKHLHIHSFQTVSLETNLNYIA
jgi:hypothetical protein